MPKSLSVPGRWLEKVAVGEPDECWPWLASRDDDGYGRFQYPSPNGQVHVRAHRWAYEHYVGPVPEGLVVMHQCDNPGCVNPAHLSVGTPLDNNADKVAKGRHARLWGTPLKRAQQTHCKRGHEFTPENTRWRGNQRRCKECEAINARIYYRRARGLPGEGQPRRRGGDEGARSA